MTQGRVERRLAAILAADVAGYGRLMGADEEGTLRALKEHRQAVFDPQIAAHHGRVVKTTGDGLLVEFASVLDAVECACAVQLAIAGRNAAVAPDRRLEFRIGINLGDVMIDGGDIYGDGVNIAARLEALAEPGSVCVSGAVRDQLGDKRLLDFRDMGEHSVKNIARPLRVYRVEARAEDGIAVPVAMTPAILALQDRPSVAVLPFTNMSGDAEQDYFADGMVEDIITALSRFKELFVIARNSSFIYKGRAVDIRQVGRELGVRYVLEGSVRKAGNRVRITGQLIEAATRSHLWADRFDAAIEDVFELQDRITESVVGALVPTLRQAEIERARRKPPADLSAYDLYLRALPSLWAGTSDGVAKAIALLRSSLDRDPMHTPALAALAWGLAMAAPLGGNTATNGRTNALKMARQAVEQDSTDAFAQAVYGYTLYGPAGQDEQGRIHSQEAVRLNPSSAFAWGTLGMIGSMGGDYENAIECFNRALALSPYDNMLYSWMTGLAAAHFALQRHEEGIACARRSIQHNPGNGTGHRMLAANLAAAGCLEEARVVTANRDAVQKTTIRELRAARYFKQEEVLERYLSAQRMTGVAE